MGAAFFVGPFISILSFFSGGAGLPLGVPPEEDPFMQKVAPEECLLYVSWAGMKKPDPNSTNSTEALLAEPEVQRIIAEIDRRLIDALTAGGEAEEGSPEALLAEHGVALGRPLLMRPTAIFIESADVAGGGPPDIKGGALVNLGEDAAEVKAALEKLQSQFAADGVKEVEIAGTPAYQVTFGPDMPQVTWGLKGVYLIVGVGDGSFEGILTRVKTETPEWLAQSLHRSEIKRVSSVVHVNLKKSIGDLLPLAGPDAEEIRFGLRALGLHNAESLCIVSGLDSKGFVSNTHLKVEGEALGLMTFVSDQPLTPLDMNHIPADATFAVAARAEAGDVYDRFKQVVGGFEPGGPDEIDRNMRQIEEQTGLKIFDGIFKGLGDVWFVYNSPSEGGLIATGLTAAVTVKDKNKLQPEFDTLMNLMRTNFEEMRMRRGGRGAALKETKFGEHTIYYIAGDDDLWVAPSFCMTDEYVIFGMFPQNVKAFLSHDDDMKSLATSEHVGPRMKMQGGPSLIVYQDTARLAQLLYPWIIAMGQTMANEMSYSGMDFDISLLPSVSVLSKHVNPGLMTLARDKDGVTMESRQSLPGGISGVATPLMLGMYAPSIKEARIAAKYNVTKNNMKQIGLAMHMYHDTHGHFPPAYTVDKEGKPLLSWRVQLLPYLEQEALYEEFRQDEPWDSDHNKALIARMPDVFRAPTSKADEGKTVYLGPRGEMTVLSGTKRGGEIEKVRMAHVRDGTSNTIMTVEASDDLAVEWTKPDDFKFDPKDPKAGLIGQYKEGFVAGFTDGSVQTLSGKIDDETLLNLFNRQDGNVTDYYRFQLDNRRRGRYGRRGYGYDAPAAAVEERAFEGGDFDHDHGDHDHAHEGEEAPRDEIRPEPEGRKEAPEAEFPREERKPDARDGASVEGKITLDGEPLAGAVIKYYLTDERRPSAVGTTAEDGKFRLRTTTGDPLRTGRYRVTIAKFSTPEGEAPDAPRALVKLTTPQKFAAPDTSSLQVEVAEGDNSVDFDLSSE